MARTDNFNNWATDVADSIRAKTGKTDKIPASSFDTEIQSIAGDEDLDAELTTYNEELTEQEDTLATILSVLETKNNGSGEDEEMIKYSLEEQVIGEWIDGRPIYRKVVDFGALPNATSGFAEHGIDNLYATINVYGFILRNDGVLFPFNYPVQIDTEQGIRTLIHADTVEINTGEIDRTNCIAYVVIEYMKTTD